MEKYLISKELGRGSYGVVSRAINKVTGEVVAVKELNQKCTSVEEGQNLIEVKALLKMNHPNIVKLKEFIIEKDMLFLIFECMECNLYDRMYTPFSETEIRDLCFQVFQGLAHMHDNGYFHRDLKPENLLLSKNMIKIADLGQALETNSKPPYTHYVTTRPYRAPEVFLRSSVYDPAVDMWAMGAIMAELFTGEQLFQGGNPGQVMYNICRVIGSPTESKWSEGLHLAGNLNYQFPDHPVMPLAAVLPSASHEALCLIASLLSWNPYERPTAMEALEHPFFEGCYHVKTPPMKPNQYLPSKPALLKQTGSLKSCAIGLEKVDPLDELICMLQKRSCI